MVVGIADNRLRAGFQIEYIKATGVGGHVAAIADDKWFRKRFADRLPPQEFSASRVEAQ